LTRGARRYLRDGPNDAGDGNSQALLASAKAMYRGVMKRLTPATSRMVLAARRLEAVRVAWRDVDLFLAPSTFVADRMIEFGLPAHRVVHSPNGMRTDLLQIHRRRGSDRTRFGYVGSIAPHKGVHVLVEAFAKFAARRTDHPVELRIHGNHAQFPEYVSRLRALAGSARVAFMGEFDNTVASRVYAEMDALVIPSIWWENAPLTLFEARLAGKPVIASDCGSLPGLIDSHDMLFRNGDTDDLVRCLTAFADRPRLVAATPHMPPVKTMEHDAREMEQRYEKLLEVAPLAYEPALISDAR
jgi:glycosyltransferase involved in cell wall biosynthesis